MIDIDYRKWGDGPHWRFFGDRLGSDEYGTWVVVHTGTSYSGPRGEGTTPHAFVLLFPNDEWWVAAFNLAGDVDVYVDIATPPQWPTDDHVTMVDLDLDVIRRRDGTVFIDDEDEFADHSVLYAYPEDVVARARTTADTLVTAVSERHEPFGNACDPWVRAVPVH
jgi:protein associated with RNAse G/E